MKRYLVTMTWWYQGELAKAQQRATKEAEATGILPSLEEMLMAKNWYETVVMAETKKEAIAKAKERAAKDPAVKYDESRIDDDHHHVTVHEVPYLTIQEVLDAPTVRTEYDMYQTAKYFQGIDEYSLDQDAIAESKRAVTRFICDVCFDGSRIMELGVLYFDGEPVLVFQNAGRSGRDHEKMWIVEGAGARKLQMHQWLLTMIPTEDGDDGEVETPLDEEIPDLSVFYGSSVADVSKYQLTQIKW